MLVALLCFSLVDSQEHAKAVIKQIASLDSPESGVYEVREIENYKRGETKTTNAIAGRARVFASKLGLRVDREFSRTTYVAIIKAERSVHLIRPGLDAPFALVGSVVADRGGSGSLISSSNEGGLYPRNTHRWSFCGYAHPIVAQRGDYFVHNLSFTFDDLLESGVLEVRNARVQGSAMELELLATKMKAHSESGLPDRVLIIIDSVGDRPVIRKSVIHYFWDKRTESIGFERTYTNSFGCDANGRRFLSKVLFSEKHWKTEDGKDVLVGGGSTVSELIEQLPPPKASDFELAAFGLKEPVPPTVAGPGTGGFLSTNSLLWLFLLLVILGLIAWGIHRWLKAKSVENRDRQ